MNYGQVLREPTRVKLPSNAPTVNGVRMDVFQELVGSVSSNPGRGLAEFGVATRWTGGTRSSSRVESWSLGGQARPRFFEIASDEPAELCGTESAPNPQELLMAAINACMMVGYVALCAAEGIELESIEIRTAGTLDLRGFLGLDESVKPGYEDVSTIVKIKGTGTEQQFLEIHRKVQATSPNYSNLTTAVACRPALVVE
ncbi:MAG: OsmC family protein [Phycisphaerales bacterium]|nr:OsmC family protein [Phycisphaerales bacterium]